jgi:hypothetical protein
MDDLNRLARMQLELSLGVVTDERNRRTGSAQLMKNINNKKINEDQSCAF